MFDLTKYLDRIGDDGPLAPTRRTLDRLLLRHLGAIPFENFDPLMGLVPDVTAEGVAAKLVTARRGGYCYEQNRLLLEALHAIGFEAHGLLCRVWWMRPTDSPPGPLSHMALAVRIDGQWVLVDAGFGGCVPTASLAMDETAPQPTPHERFRLRRVAEGRMLELEIDGAWQPVYEFKGDRPDAQAFRAANHEAATNSRFRHELMMARTTPEARLSLGGNRFIRRTMAEGVTERRSLSPEALEVAIRERFGLSVDPAWRPLLARVTGAADA